MSDRIAKIRIEPHFTAEFIAGICYGNTDHTGVVVGVIRATDDGKPQLELRRERVDATLPAFLKRQAD